MDRSKIRLDRAWAEVIPFLGFDPAIRKSIYTTNAIESLNRVIGKSIKTRGSFPTDEAATKLICLAIRNFEKDVHIYALTGAFMGFAPCQIATGFRDLTAAKENARAKAQFRRAHRKLLKAERGLSRQTIAAQLDAIPMPDPVVAETKIVALPRGDARPVAARVAHPEYQDTMTPEQEADIIAFQERFHAEQERRQAKAKEEEPIDRYRRAVTLEQELSAGKDIGASAANWLRGYQTTSEYFAHSDMHRDVGDHFVWVE